MFCCGNCHYKTNKKFNLQKHIKNVHIRDPTDHELKISNDEQITSYEEQITSKSGTNNIKNETNNIKNGTNNIIKKNTIFNSCSKCQKNFKSYNGYKKHQNICKGVVNILECHYCHKVLATQQSKSTHLKKCKIKLAQIIVKDYNHSNNIINNTNTQNNITNYNI